ncbi:kinetochore protein Spc24 [Zonotrichia albicollis]|uniref:kinetochore protein Spc24 n=1 Tax=Zonotrichia albicollis TaxID=44394 RepID=UPI003D80EF01
MRGAAPPGSNSARERARRESGKNGRRRAPPGGGGGEAEPGAAAAAELGRASRSCCGGGCSGGSGCTGGSGRRRAGHGSWLRVCLRPRPGLCHRLQGAQADAQRLRGRRQELDTELCQAQGSLGTARDRTQALRRALQELQEQLQQNQDEEDEEQSLPPDVYVAQLYYEISRIDWDCSAEPGRIRGVHYGPDIAVPLDLDGAQHSGTFVSDFLWGLVPTEWRARRPPGCPREPLAP